jgi:FkbM family methyltransferase
LILTYYTKKAIRFLGKRLLAFSENIPYWNVKVLERDGNWVLCQTSDAIFRLDSTKYLDQQILNYGFFEKDSINWVKKLVKPGMVTVDVGANFGYYTMLLSKFSGSTGKVIAFEPLSTFYDRLLYHAKINNCTNVVLVKEGLSSQAEQLTIFLNQDTATLHWPANEPPPEVPIQQISLITLDDYVSKNDVTHIDFIKVDIDGHEPHFLKGAENSLSKFEPIILMEFAHLNLLASGSGSDHLAHQLCALGYELYSEQTGKPYPSMTDFLVDAMNCAYSKNVLCIPKSKHGII